MTPVLKAEMVEILVKTCASRRGDVAVPPRFRPGERIAVRTIVPILDAAGMLPHPMDEEGRVFNEPWEATPSRSCSIPTTALGRSGSNI